MGAGVTRSRDLGPRNRRQRLQRLASGSVEKERRTPCPNVTQTCTNSLRPPTRPPPRSPSHPVDSGGLEPCRCSRPVRDAAPQSLPQSSAVTGSRPLAGPGRRRSQLPRIQPDAFDAPDFVGIGAKPARQDGQRGRRNGRGGVLGHLAIWHDRGPGGRLGFCCRSRWRGHPRTPIRSRPEMAVISIPLI